MPAPANKAAWRLFAACLTISLVPSAFSTSAQAQEPPLVTTSDRQDSFYCEERKLGYWFYCSKPRPAEVEVEAPAVTPSATSQLDAITANLRELKAKAILEPTPANVTAYIRFQRAQLDRASLFSDVWQRAIWQDPDLDYTLQRPVSTLGKRAWIDERKNDRDRVMASLSQRYGVFYFFASSCGACDIFSPILKAVSDKYGLSVLAVSTDGGPSATFPGYMVDSGQYEKLGLGTDRQVPALVLFDSVTKQPMPIGYGILSQDEIMDRVFQLTQVAAGSDY